MSLSAELSKFSPLHFEGTFNGDILLEPVGTSFRVFLNGKQVVSIDRKQNSKAAAYLASLAKEHSGSDDPKMAEFYGSGVSFKVQVKQRDFTPIMDVSFDGIPISAETPSLLENLGLVLKFDLGTKYQEQQRGIVETMRNAIDAHNADILSTSKQSGTRVNEEEWERKSFPKDTAWFLKELQDTKQLRSGGWKKYFEIIKKYYGDHGSKGSQPVEATGENTALAAFKDVEAMAKSATRLAERICRSLKGNFERTMGKFRYDKNNQSCLICLRTPTRNKKMYFVISIFVDGSVGYRPYSKGSANEYDLLPWFTGAIYPSNGRFFVQQMVKDIGDDVSAFDRMTFAGATVKFPENKTANEYIPLIQALGRRQIARLIGSVDYSAMEEFRANFVEWLEENGSKRYPTWLDAYAAFHKDYSSIGLIPKWWVNPGEFEDMNLYEQMKAA